MQIKTLAIALGKPLFVRKPRNVVSTRDGEVLSYARRLLALRDKAWAAGVRPDVSGREPSTCRIITLVTVATDPSDLNCHLRISRGQLL
jgi:DNA-binding transcriptional LysR family regulator